MADKTPPKITTGSFVSWSNGKGRVDLLVNSGKVPGVEGDHEATGDAPMARVVVWEDGKATNKKIAASTHTLRRIPPIGGADGKKGLDAALAMHKGLREYVEEIGLPAQAGLSDTAVKTAYERGVKSWPGAERTTLTAEEWGVGRVEHLFKAAVSTEPVATNDDDLLYDDDLGDEQVEAFFEEAAPRTADPDDEGDEGDEGDEEVTVEAADVEAELAAVEAALNDDDEGSAS